DRAVPTGSRERGLRADPPTPLLELRRVLGHGRPYLTLLRRVLGHDVAPAVARVVRVVAVPDIGALATDLPVGHLLVGQRRAPGGNLTPRCAGERCWHIKVALVRRPATEVPTRLHQRRLVRLGVGPDRGPGRRQRMGALLD